MARILFAVALLYHFSAIGQSGEKYAAGSKNAYLSRVDHFSVEQGMSSRFINCLLEDSEGFLWIGTNYGLDRYDGHEFLWLTSQNQPFRYDIVGFLAEDPDGFIWIANYDRANAIGINMRDVYLLDRESLTSKNWKEAFPHAPIEAEQITRFCSKNGKVWLTTRAGQLYAYTGSGRFELLFEDKMFAGAEIYPTFQNTLVLKSSLSEGEGWWYAELDEQGNTLCRRLFGFDWEHLETDTAGTRWILNSGGGPLPLPGFIYAFRNDRDQPVHHSLSRLGLPADLAIAQVNLLRFDPELNAYWFAKPGHAFVFSPEKGLIHEFHDPDNALDVTSIKSCFGKGNKLWIADYLSGGGLFQLSLQKRLFKNYLPGYPARGITETGDGRLYISTQLGEVFLDTNTLKIEFPYPPQTGGLSVLRSRQGDIWTGGFNPFLARIPPGKTKALLNRIPFSSSGETWSLHESSASGRIWFGGENAFGCFNPKDSSSQLFRDFGKFPGLKNQRVAFFMEESPGLFWLATSNGLYLLDEEKGLLEWHGKDAPAGNRLPARFINHIHKDRDGIFWLATRGDGLVRWDREKNIAQSFKIEQGLSHNVLYAIYEDRHDGLWISSDRGIMRFDKNNHQVRAFLLRDGIPHEEFNTNSHYQAADGRIWFGGLFGVTVFDPEDFYRQGELRAAQLHISRFEQFDASQNRLVDRSSELLRTMKIVLEPGDKSFLLKCSLLDFEPATSSQFAYKIQGLDNDWIYQKENTIRVNGLPSGSYRLLVKAQGANGLWSAEPLALDILVKKPFYRQNWFYALGLLLLGGLIWWRFWVIRQAKAGLERIVTERTRQIERDKKTIEAQAAELRELDQMKSRFFANVSHELRTPLTLILGPLAKLLQLPATVPEIREHLSIMQRNSHSLLRLVEEILDLSKLEAGKLQLSEHPVALLPLVRRIMAAFQSQAEIQEIRYKLRFDEDPGLRILLDAAKFERILTNLLSNAFKFTPKGGAVEVVLESVAGTSAEPDSAWLSLQVRDTGRGISADDLPLVFDRYFQTKRSDMPLEGGTGIGLALSKEYALLFGGRLELESEPGKGSVFSFIFPKKVASPEAISAEPAPDAPSDWSQENTPASRTDSVGNFPLQANLLLVEDNADMQKFVREILSPFGTVNVAANGREALELLRDAGKKLPDLLVSDLMMPEMDGLELLKNLRAEDAWRHIPAVMLTARAGKEDRLTALRLGVDDYLTKPFDADELQARVRNLLLRQQRRREMSAATLPFEPVSSADERWLKSLEEKSLAALDRGLLSVTWLADELALSERQFRRKVEQLTGLSPNDYLREVRLQKARHLLESRAAASVAEIAYTVGYNKVDYFSRLYVERFGKLPSGYR